MPQHSEKKDDMGKNSAPKIWLTLVLALGFATLPFTGSAKGARSQPGIDDARELLKIERQYFEDRTASRWDEIYQVQHPRLKKRITRELFINRAGLVGFDTVDLLKSRRSGGLSIMPPPNDVVTTPRDALGFPTTRSYRIIANPWVNIDEHHFNRVWISPEGRYARVDVKLDVTERLPSHLFRVDMVLPHTRDHFDYWEKVDGEWVVALMVHRVSISGSKIPVIFIPQQIEALDKIKWIGFDPEKLKTAEADHE